MNETSGEHQRSFFSRFFQKDKKGTITEPKNENPELTPEPTSTTDILESFAAKQAAEMAAKTKILENAAAIQKQQIAASKNILDSFLAGKPNHPKE